jgi:hypothetical protein
MYRYEQFEKALASDKLIELVNLMVAEGLGQVEIYYRFDLFRDSLHRAGRADEEDRIKDVMDVVIGWCAPHAKIFSRCLTNEEIENHRNKQGL